MARKSQRVRRRVSAPFAAQSRPPCWPYGPVSRSSQAQSPTRALYPAAWRGHFPHTPPSPPPSPPPPPPPRPLPPNVHCKYAGVERHWTNSNSTSNRSCSAHTHTPHDAAAPRTETPPPTTPHSRRRRRRRPSAARAPPQWHPKHGTKKKGRGGGGQGRHGHGDRQTITNHHHHGKTSPPYTQSQHKRARVRAHT